MSEVQATQSAPVSETSNSTPEVTPEVAPEATPEVAEKAPPKPAKRKVKANGRDVEVAAEDEDRYISLGIASHERFQAAAEERKQAERLYKKMKDDPFGAMAELGLNPREVSESWLVKQLELEMMTPEQKKAHEMEQKLKAYEEKEALTKKEQEEQAEAEKKAKEEQELADLTAQYKEDYTNQFIAALEKTNLPKNYTTMRRIAEVIMQHRLKNQDIPVEKAIKIVEKDSTSSIKDMIEALEGEDLVNFLGSKAAEKIRKHELSKIKNPVPQASKFAEKPEPKPEKTKEYVDPYEWKKKLMRQYADE